MAGVYKDKRSGKNKGSWYFVINLGKGLDGKPKRIKKTGFPTRDAALQARAETLLKIKSGTYTEPSEELYADYLEGWFKAKRLSIDSQTAKSYESYIKNHIIPLLGHFKLKNINGMIIQEFITALNEKGLSARTIRKIYTVVHSSLENAYRLKLIQDNPASAVIALPKIEKTELKVWNEEQARRFLREAKKLSRYYIAFYLALVTGMRQGEILGLRWSDIDFDKGIIYVRQTVSHDGKEIRSRTKSFAGLRQIEIDEETIKELKWHRQNQLEEIRQAGPEYKNYDLVVCTSNGNITHPRSLVDAFNTVLKKVDVPKIPFHGLRHTHASLLLKAGVHPKVVQERLGHSSIQMTQDIYSHLFPNMQKEAVEKVKSMYSWTQNDIEEIEQEIKDEKASEDIRKAVERIRSLAESKIAGLEDEEQRKAWEEILFAAQGFLSKTQTSVEN